MSISPISDSYLSNYIESRDSIAATSMKIPLPDDLLQLHPVMPSCTFLSVGELNEIQPEHIPSLKKVRAFFYDPQISSINWERFQKTLAYCNEGVYYSLSSLETLGDADLEEVTPTDVADAFFSLRLKSGALHHQAQKSHEVAWRALGGLEASTYDFPLVDSVHSVKSDNHHILYSESFWKAVSAKIKKSTLGNFWPEPKVCKSRYLDELKIDQKQSLDNNKDRELLSYILRAALRVSCFDFQLVRDRILSLKGFSYTEKVLLDHYKSLVQENYDFSLIDASISFQQDQSSSWEEAKRLVWQEVDRRIEELEFKASSASSLSKRKNFSFSHSFDSLDSKVSRSTKDSENSSIKTGSLTWDEATDQILLDAYSKAREGGYGARIWPHVAEMCKSSGIAGFNPSAYQCSKRYSEYLDPTIESTVMKDDEAIIQVLIDRFERKWANLRNTIKDFHGRTYSTVALRKCLKKNVDLTPYVSCSSEDLIGQLHLSSKTSQVDIEDLMQSDIISLGGEESDSSEFPRVQSQSGLRSLQWNSVKNTWLHLALAKIHPFLELRYLFDSLSFNICMVSEARFYPTSQESQSQLKALLDSSSISTISDHNLQILYKLIDCFTINGAIDLEMVRIAIYREKRKTYTYECLLGVLAKYNTFQRPASQVTDPIRELYPLIDSLRFDGGGVDQVLKELSEYSKNPFISPSSASASGAMFQRVCSKDSQPVVKLCALSLDEQGEILFSWLHDQIQKRRNHSYTPEALEANLCKTKGYADALEKISAMNLEEKKTHFDSLIHSLAFVETNYDEDEID